MRVSPSEKKKKLSKKWFARLSNSTIMEKVFQNIEFNVDSIDLDQKKHATDTLLKILPYIMPKEGNGNAPLVAINNNTQINGKAGDKVLQTISEYMTQRDSQTKALENRQEKKRPKLEPGKEIKVEKLPANSPLNKQESK